MCACDRSWMSKLVAPTDMGKAFAFFGLFQAIAPLLATPVVGVIYTWSSKVVKQQQFNSNKKLCISSLKILTMLRTSNIFDQKKVRNKS